ncbi:MAG: HAMP domain-containing histidine kinase [Oscillospiraceae bacterium]|nr:HAMP domain-containing histidine kinase [Oscillospiraceae bacterium]
MLKRLRIKFVLVIMFIVTALFTGIFGIGLHMTRTNLKRDSLQMMRAMAYMPSNSQQMRIPNNMPNSIPNNMQNNFRMPFFTVYISDEGNIKAEGAEYYGITDEETLTKIVRTAETSKQPDGVLSDYDLRYLRVETMRARVIVFADISSEKAMIHGLVRNALFAGFIGCSIFFVISLLLVKWVTKPVETTWNEQKQFIADASHELKTPLTVIITNAEMLNDQSYPDSDKAQCSRNILSTSQRMRGLVESLLELARLDQHRIKMQRERIQLSKIVNDSILPFEPMFYENGMTLNTEIEEHIAAEGEADKLRQVVTILLDNALKYSDPAKPVTVKLKRQASNAVLTVSGAGEPLSKEDCKKVFKRFYRADPSRNDHESYGLGLSIAESIIREHGGKIWAESTDGYNIFSVSLPI